MSNRGQILGHIECPTCGFPDMEVKADKNGNPFGFCPDCSQQLPTHGGLRGKKLLARPGFRSVTVTEATPAAPVVTEPAPGRAPGVTTDDNPPAADPGSAAPPSPKPKKKPAGCLLDEEDA